MAWTAPTSWVTGKQLNQANLDEQVTNNLIYLKSAIEPEADQYRETSTNYSTTSGSLADVDATDFHLEITTTGGDVMITLCGWCSNTGGNHTAFAIDLDDGTEVRTIMEVEGNADDQCNCSFVYIWQGLSAGTHSFTLQWLRNSGGTSYLFNGVVFDAREILGVAPA